jgi:hypothetical protein
MPPTARSVCAIIMPKKHCPWSMPSSDCAQRRPAPPRHSLHLSINGRGVRTTSARQCLCCTRHQWTSINGRGFVVCRLLFDVYKDLGVEDVIVRPTNEHRPAPGHRCQMGRRPKNRCRPAIAHNGGLASTTTPRADLDAVHHIPSAQCASRTPKGKIDHQVKLVSMQKTRLTQKRNTPGFMI